MPAKITSLLSAARRGGSPAVATRQVGAPAADARADPSTSFFAPPHPRLIAHRGASGTHPENTLAAFRAAAEAGAEMIELDVHLSADRVPVVIHDATLGRTTGARGTVSTRTADELERVDAGHRFSADRGRTYPFRGQGQGVPRLSAVLAALPRTRFILEVKSADPAIDAALHAALDVADAHGRVLVASHHGDLVRRLRKAFPDLPTNVGEDEVASFLQEGPGALPPGARVFAVPPRYGLRRLVTAAFVRAAHAAGLEVHVWTVNAPAAMHALLDLGVDGIMTDFPERLLAVYRERGLR